MIGKMKRLIKNPELLNDWMDKKIQKTLYSIAPTKRFAARCRRIAIMVNSVCNLRCKMCDIGQKSEDGEFYKNIAMGGELSFSVLKNLIDDVRDMNPVIAINGTEPLLYKDLPKLINYISNSGLKCDLTTNGYLLEKAIKDLVSVRLRILNISIDGPPNVHDTIRGVPGSFERAFKSIVKLNEMKKRLGKKYPRIFISFTISPYNYNYLYETTKLFYNIVDAIVFSHLNFITPEMAEKHEKCFGHVCSVHPSSTSTISDLDRMDEYVLSKEIKRVKNNFPDFVFFSPDISSPESIRVYYKQPEVFLTSKQCLVPWVNAQILPNGDVIPASRCFHLRLGNIVEDKFTDIWRGEAYQLLRKELSKIGSTPACSRCCGIF